MTDNFPLITLLGGLKRARAILNDEAGIRCPRST
jgi:hypothetical protein